MKKINLIALSVGLVISSLFVACEPVNKPLSYAGHGKNLVVTFYSDSASEWRGKTTHWNGNVLWVTSEGYKNRKDCVGVGLRMLADLATGSNSIKMVISQDAADEWRGQIVHNNGNVLWKTSEGYKNRQDLEAAYANMIDSITDGKISIE